MIFKTGGRRVVGSGFRSDDGRLSRNSTSKLGKSTSCNLRAAVCFAHRTWIAFEKEIEEGGKIKRAMTLVML